MTEEMQENGQEGQKNDIETRRLTKLLKVMFAVKERLGMGDQMANAVRNIKQAQEELKSVKAQYDSKIKQFEAEIANMSERLNSGWEMRSVECEEIKDFQTGNVITRRIDTGERIEERAMTFEERQQELPFNGKESTPNEEAEEGGEEDDQDQVQGGGNGGPGGVDGVPGGIEDSTGEGLPETPADDC